MNYKIILLLAFLSSTVIRVTASRGDVVENVQVRRQTRTAPDPEGSYLTDACTCFGLGFAGACGVNFIGRALVDTFKAEEQPWTTITSIFAAGGLVFKWWHDQISARRMLVKIVATTAGIVAGSYFGNVGYEYGINWLKGQGSHPGVPTVAPAVQPVAEPVASPRRAQQFDVGALAAAAKRRFERKSLLRIARGDDTVN